MIQNHFTLAKGGSQGKMKKKQPEQQKYLSVIEMAHFLGISRMNAYSLCRRENFPAVRVSPRRIIVPVDALADWMKENAGV